MENIYIIKESKEEGKEYNLEYALSPNCPLEYLSRQFLRQFLIPRNFLVLVNFK